MTNKSRLNSQCPVCYMKIDSGSLSANFDGIEYRFCSQQCRERFIANPYLYTGRKGSPSVKQCGAVIYKKRTLKLAEIIPFEVAEELKQLINTMMGIKSIYISNNNIEITYDLLQVTAEQIEKVIEHASQEIEGKNKSLLSSGWGEKVKRAFISYLEETELDNLEEEPKPQCHDQNNH